MISRATPRWWGVCTRRVRTTRRGSRTTSPSTSLGCTQSRAPCPPWTRPSCPYRGPTLWRTWTWRWRWAPGRRTSTSRTALKTGQKGWKRLDSLADLFKITLESIEMIFPVGVPYEPEAFRLLASCRTLWSVFYFIELTSVQSWMWRFTTALTHVWNQKMKDEGLTDSKYCAI